MVFRKLSPSFCAVLITFFFGLYGLKLSAQTIDTMQVPTFQTGKISDALYASSRPNNQKVGVYLTVCKENELSPQEWAETLFKYFQAYGFPVSIILDEDPPDGEAALALIYVGGVGYEGNLSWDGIGLQFLFNNHQTVFTEIASMYKRANPNLFGRQK